MIHRSTVVSLASIYCAVAIGSVPAGQQPSRFRSSADAVLVDVQVKARGKPVAGLTAADFELRDSGVLQEIQAVALEDVPISVLLALDTSASVRGEALEHLKDAARAAIAALRRDDQAALLAFSEKIRLSSEWTTDRAALVKAVGSLEAEGSTSLYDAVVTGVGLRERAKGRTVVIVFTDGRDTTSWLGAHAAIQAAQRSDVVVYAVSAAVPIVGENATDLGRAMTLRNSLRAWFESDPELYPYAFLEKLTEQTGGELTYVSSTRDLSRVFASIVADFKSRYLLTFAPKGVPPSGWHPIEVKLKGKTGNVTARRGYSR
jgi:Ca-activated chloride channel family protein